MWVLGGCLVTLILVGAGAGYGIYSFIQGVAHGSTTCLPSDFPRYPGSRYADEDFGLNNVYPGFTCHIVFDSDDQIDTVSAFYSTKLNTGSWQVTLNGKPPGRITFQRANNGTPFGTVQIANGTTTTAATAITIDTYTSTCLPVGFPHYPGSRFGGQSFATGGAAVASRCHVVFLSKDRVAAVTTFYKSKLNTGNWQVRSSAGGQIEWVLLDGWTTRYGRRVSAHGTVTVALDDDRTDITVDSS